MDMSRIYDECMARAQAEGAAGCARLTDIQHAKRIGDMGQTQWIHLADAVSQKTVSPMESYDALRLGYVPEYLKVRDSRYSHLP